MCPVCGAPPIPDAGVCAFCRSELALPAAPDRVLDYLARVLKPATVRRRGLLRRGTVRYVELETPEALFIGRTDRGGRLRLLPDVDVTTWTAGVVQAFGRAAAADGDLRERISRAGWSFG